jgi:aspartate aminotransferase
MIKISKTDTEFELSPIPQRLKQALADNAYRKDYLPALGLPELREAVRDYYSNQIGLDLSGHDVIISPGSKLILYTLQMAIEGDLIMPVPSWVSYAPQSKMLGRKVIYLPTELSDKGYFINPDDLKEVILSARKEGLNPSKLILNSPNNPTGLIMPEENLKEIAAVCDEEDVFVISDEIYGLVNFDKNYHSILKYLPNKTAITSGLSKHLSLGGWRVGIGFVPKAIDGLLKHLRHSASELWSSVPAPIQCASVEAYKAYDDIESHIKDCTQIHTFVNQRISQGFKNCGVICALSQGAFYNYPDFDPLRSALLEAGVKSSKDLSEYLINTYGLVTLPGVAFGAAPDNLTLRVSGCDYDGEKALAAFQSGQGLDDEFMSKYMPNVAEGIHLFEKCVNELSSSGKSASSI